MGHSDNLFQYIVSGIYSENVYMKDKNIFKSFFIKKDFKGRNRLINIINKRDSRKKLAKNEYDILHPTEYDPYVLSYKKVPLVIDAHDMIWEMFRNEMSNSKAVIENKRKLFFAADKIIAKSNNTKQDVLKFYPNIPEKKIVVIYHGNSFISESEKDIRKDRYLLFTGNRGLYKNFDRFIDAIAPVLKKYDLNLICTGTKFTPSEVSKLYNLGILNKCQCTFVYDTELLDLYKHALLFVFPSLYEGFGIPILEAFAAKCPIVLSNTSCFPEIAANAAVYFDPYNIDDIKEKVEEVLLNDKLKQELVLRGSKRLEYFTWENATKETVKLYKDVL
jgi:glycosyltransferase involved in cell wall biosynthesis